MAENDSNTPVGGFSPEDTKTRKTVRLHPAKAPELISQERLADPLGARDTDTSNLEILDDTQTRRTVKIKPISPAGSSAVKLPIDADTNTRKTVVLRPQAGTDGANTNTRKTVMLRPTSGEGENTNTRKTVMLRPMKETPATVNA